MTGISSLTRTRIVAAATLGALVVGLAVALPSTDAKPKKKNGKEKVDLTSQFDVRTVAAGFNRSISFDYLPNGKMLVAEKVGRIYLVEPGGGTKLLLDISAQVQNERERGLEGIAVASDFASSRRVYYVYTYLVNPLRPSGPQALRLSYLTLDAKDNVANPETVVLGKDATGPCPAVSNKRDCPASIAATHQGGTVVSDPDGSLWVGYGDSNLPQSPGNQVFRTFNPESTAGKILHIDSSGNGLPGHPFCKKTKDLTRTCTKVFATGFRNPFRFVLTPGGNPLVADVGWNSREEINLVKRGRNYGWPCKEGTLQTPFYSERRRCQTLYAKRNVFSGPIYEYPNNVKLGGAAAIMGPQHQSPSYPPGLAGAYFFGDYASSFIKEGVLRKGKLKGIRTVATGVLPVQFRVAPNGNIAFIDFLSGTVNELVYAPNKAPIAAASASPEAFCNADSPVTFSAAGTTDPEGDALTYRWDFESNGSIDATGATAVHSYPNAPDPATYTATLHVSDGGSTSSARVTVYAGDCPPAFSVSSPAGESFRIGTPVPLVATGSDPDGALSNSAFRWDVVLIHKGHTHEVGTFLGRSTEFQPVADHDADSHYEVTLSVTDSFGYTAVGPKIEVHPETVRLRLRADIGKVKLSYGGRTVRTPDKFEAAIGFRANLSAPATVQKGGVTYRFKRWSDGARRNRVFTIPDEPTKLVAKYRRGR